MSKTKNSTQTCICCFHKKTSWELPCCSRPICHYCRGCIENNFLQSQVPFHEEHLPSCPWCHHNWDLWRITRSRYRHLRRISRFSLPDCSDNYDEERRWEREGFISLRERLWLFMYTKRCPACGIAIERNGGCTKMVCGWCGKHFDWISTRKVKLIHYCLWISYAFICWIVLRNG